MNIHLFRCNAYFCTARVNHAGNAGAAVVQRPNLVNSDDNLVWNVARSWDLVEESRYLDWVTQLKRVAPRNIENDDDVYYFSAGEGARGMATQLAGGRVVVVWGYMDWSDLNQKFLVASDRVFEARY